MAPRTASRHSFTLGVADELARRFLTERVPYSFKEHGPEYASFVDDLDGMDVSAVFPADGAPPREARRHCVSRIDP